GALLLVACAGCGSSSGAKGTFTLSLSGFDIHINQTVFLKVKLNGTTMGQAQGVVSQQATLTLVVDKVLEAGNVYNADFFADVDGNGAYRPPTGGIFHDHSWRKPVPGDSNGAQLNFVHDTLWTDISPF